MTRILAAMAAVAALITSAGFATLYTSMAASAHRGSAEPGREPAADRQSDRTVTAFDRRWIPRLPGHGGSSDNPRTHPGPGTAPDQVGKTRARIAARHEAQWQRDLANNRMTPDGHRRAVITRPPVRTPPLPPSPRRPEPVPPSVAHIPPAVHVPPAVAAPPPVPVPAATPPVATKPVTDLASSSELRPGYSGYLKEATTAHVAMFALPGAVGLAAFTALGILIGYRNARSARGVTPAAMRYTN